MNAVNKQTDPSTIHNPQSIVATGTVALPGLEHPPVHPKCRYFDSRSLAQYAAKLHAAGETRALQQLSAVFRAVIFQPSTRWAGN